MSVPMCECVCVISLAFPEYLCEPRAHLCVCSVVVLHDELSDFCLLLAVCVVCRRMNANE